MKNLFLLVVLLSLSSVYANERYELNKDEIFVNVLGTETTFEIVRTNQTPETVIVEVKHDIKYRQTCLRWSTGNEWVPPRTEYVCEPDRERCHEVDGRRICERIEGECRYVTIPGRNETRYTCDEYGTIDEGVYKKVKLNFKNAQKLNENESEIFEVTISREDDSSTIFKMKGKVIEALSDYTIKSKQPIFSRLGLYFIKNQ